MSDQLKELVEFVEGRYPIMREIVDLSAKICRVEQEAKEETEDFDRLCGFERLHYLDNKRFEKVAQFLTQYCHEISERYAAIVDKSYEQNEKLLQKLQEECQANSEAFESMCYLFLVDPRKAFETLLGIIERDKKTENQDGFENWQWGLHFPLTARLRMAWGLVFGKKNLSEVDHA